MGLNDLWSNLKSQWESVDPSDLHDKTLAIDGQVWLYESCKETQLGPDNFLVGFYNRCKALIDMNIRPFILLDQYQCHPLPKVNQNDLFNSKNEFCFVRDGRPLKVNEGARTRYGRNSTKLKNINKVTELLDSMGIAYFISKAVDNEAAGSFLEEMQKVDGFVSPDLDYFLYGGQNVYQIEFEKGIRIVSIQRMSGQKLFETHGLNRSRLVALGVLLGCDYMEKKLNGVGIVTALEIIGEFSIHEDDHPCTILDRFRCYCDTTFTPKTETPIKKKLRSTYFSFSDFNPNSDSMAEGIDAYMWPNLENLPFVTTPPLNQYNQERVMEMISCPLALDDGSDASVEIIEDSPKRKSNRKRKSTSISSLSPSSPCIRNGGMKRRVMRCPSEWSRREWQAILTLKKSTTQAYNELIPDRNGLPVLKTR